MPEQQGAPAADRQSVRAFIAIPLPDNVLSALGEVQRTLSRNMAHGSVRWVRPEGIHLTLKFLGDTLVQRLPAIEAALSAVARNAPAFTFDVGGVGCFPDVRRPRVVWVGVEEPQQCLARLQAAIEEALCNIGLPPEDRPFAPHLTLGRVDRGSSRNEAAQVGETVAGTSIGTLAHVPADQVHLIRSVLKPTGAEYHTLGAFSLRGP